MKTGIDIIADERRRHTNEEGWTPEHDDKHDKGELAQAAACYCMRELVDITYRSAFTFAAIMQVWPFSQEWWKPTPDNRIKELAKAGAMIAAEIDRIRRLDGFLTPMIYKLTFEDGRVYWCTAQNELHLLKSYDAYFDLSLQEVKSIEVISEDKAKATMVCNPEFDEDRPDEMPETISLYDLAVGDDFKVIASTEYD